MEAWLSGLKQHTANVLTGKPVRRFESSRLRLRSAIADLRRGEARKKVREGDLHLSVMYYVYSLKCNDGYYVGCTDNLEDRLERHRKGQVSATADRLPIKLDSYFAIEDKYKAFEFEKYLKSGSGRAFLKKHLI